MRICVRTFFHYFLYMNDYRLTEYICSFIFFKLKEFPHDIEYDEFCIKVSFNEKEICKYRVTNELFIFSDSWRCNIEECENKLYSYGVKFIHNETSNWFEIYDEEKFVTSLINNVFIKKENLIKFLLEKNIDLSYRLKRIENILNIR